MINLTLDSAAGVDVDIWRNQLGAYDDEEPLTYARTGWGCVSEQNPASGACATTLSELALTGEGTIRLMFTEQRTRQRVVLNLKAWQTHKIYHDLNCHGETKISPDSAGIHTCVIDGERISTAGKRLSVTLPASEIDRLPYGGIWSASLEMNYLRHPGNELLTPWNADITLNLQRAQEMQVYLVNSGGKFGHVELPLGAGNGAAVGKEGPRTSVETCLFDGYGLHSSSIEMRVVDPDNHSGDGLFYVRHGGVNSADQRQLIAYHVTASAPGSEGERVLFRNDQPLTFSEFNRARTRMTKLPGIAEQVPCVPWTLYLEAFSFKPGSKRSGSYAGVLQIIFTPSLLA